MNLKTITINGVEIPLEKVCEECGGDGIGEIALYINMCSECHGLGTIPIYYTVKKLKKIGFVFHDKSVVYMLYTGNAREIPHGWRCTEMRFVDKRAEKIAVSLFPGQPAPPADYRARV